MTRSLAVLAVVVGCTSVRQLAETAYSKRHFRAAAALFDDLVKKHPDDVAARQRRTDARIAVLREMLIAVQAARRASQPTRADRLLEDLLDQRADWEMAIDRGAAPALAVEVTATGDHLAAEVDQVARTIGPLAAEARLADHEHLLAYPDFADRGRAMLARVGVVGRARCDALVAETSETRPAWSWLVERYCTHFGAAATIPRGTFPNLRTGLELDGGVGGLSDLEAVAFRGALADAFRTSAWYAPNGTGTLHATLQGTLAATFGAHPIAQSASWTEQVPYTDYETEQESYQEPYDDTESYSEQVPYTEYQTQTEACGTTTCTSTVPVTVYRTEWKTRTVTKYRTAYRDVQKAVTRYRDVPHTFDYVATQRTGHYASQLAIAVDAAPPLASVAATVGRDDTATGIEHDVTFEPAGVVPVRADLETWDHLVTSERARLAARLVAELDARYAATYCTATVYTRDAAAACSYLDPARVPEPVHATLRGTFAADEPFLARILTRSR